MSNQYEPPIQPSGPGAAPSGAAKPGKVQAIAIMMLVGGILATISGLLIALTTLIIFWPFCVYGVVFGILTIIKGTKLLGANAHLEPPPKGTAIMQIINIINCDFPNLVMGIIALVFLNDPEVRGYYQGR